MGSLPSSSTARHRLLPSNSDPSDSFAVPMSFCAANNVDHLKTIGKLADGTYDFLPSDSTRPHLHYGADATSNGSYGPGGIFRLVGFIGEDRQPHSGVGIHAGKANAGAYKHPTYGCVRTTESAISYITWLAKFDPLTTLTVTNNRPRVNTKTGTQSGGANSTIRYGPVVSAGSGWSPFGWSGFDVLQFLSDPLGIGGGGGGGDEQRSITFGPPSQ